MSFPGKALSRLAALFRKRDIDREMDAEFRSHIEMRTEANLAAGMPLREAAREAKLAFGNARSLREECREARWSFATRQSFLLFQDLRFALRQLRKHPGFTVAAVLTLALGIGAVTSIASIVRAALIDPLPMKNPERFLDLLSRHRRGGWLARGLNPIAAREAEAATNLFKTAALTSTDTLTLDIDGFPQPLGVFRVTRGFFPLARATPLFGRLPARDDYRPGAPGVMVLGHDLWRSAFGGDPEVAGRVIRFKEGGFTVIGVMKPGFRFPSTHGTAWVAWSGPSAAAGDAFAANRSLSLPDVGAHVELRSGVSVGQVDAWLAALQARQRGMDPLQEDFEFISQPMSNRFTKPETRRTLWMLLAVAVAVLLIASANLASLQLARTEARRQELAVRSALGARRWRVFRQLLVESLALAALGGVAGMLAAWWAIDLLGAFLPAELPRLRPLEADWSVFGIASGITLLAAALFGAGPAWRGSQTNLNEALKGGAAARAGGRRRLGWMGGLVVGQVAMAFILLAGAGLMARSVHKLLRVDVGFDPRNLIRLYPYFDLKHFQAGSPEAAAARVQAAYDELQRRLAAIPGVAMTGLSQGSWPPVEAVAEDGARHQIDPYLVGTGPADPLRAAKARLVSGRWLTRDDAEGGASILVNETAAGRLWPGGRAEGRRLRLKLPEGNERTTEVVGVVADLRENSYGEAVRPTFFAPSKRMPITGPGRPLALRTTVPFENIRASVEQHLREAGAGAARPAIVPVEQLLRASAADRRAFAFYLTALAGAGLGLAALGLYGVLAFNAGRRTREVGIRMALGATRREVTGLVLREGFVCVFWGGALGIAGALALGRVMRSFLFGIEPNDPLTLTGVALLLAFAALLGCWPPARRAARSDPMLALRAD